MTTTAVLAAAPTSAPQPVPWRRLAWVAWRRYRGALLATGALAALVAVFVVVRGEQMRSAYAALQACAPKSSVSCRFGYQNFHDHYGNLGPMQAMLVWIPGLIGAFAGGPLLARELETGTFRFAWTQGVGRMRWLAALLVSGATGVVLLNLVMGLVLTWYEQPLVSSGIEQRLHTSMFPYTGVAVAGWGLFAYALGVLVGLLMRRVVPAIAVTLVVWTGFAFLAANVLRNHYEAPLATSSLQLAPGDLPITQWWTHGGVRVGAAQINPVLQAIGVQSSGGGNFQANPGSNASVDPTQYLLQHGFLQWTSYQPDSRYWPFQGIEFGWLAVLSLLCVAVTLWLVRRRAA